MPDLWAQFRNGCPGVMLQDCSAIPDTVEPNSGIAGIGVVLGFVIPAYLAFINAFVLWFVDTQHEHTSPNPCRLRKTFEALMLGLSDTQLITSLALLSAGFAKECQLAVYHYNIVSDLVMISTSTHAFTLLMLPRYLREHPWQALVRSLIVLVIGAFTFRASYFGIRMVSGHDASVARPAKCYLSKDIAHPIGPFNALGTILASFTVAVLFATLMSFSVRVKQWIDRFGRCCYVVRVAIMGLIPIATLFYATWKLFFDRSALKPDDGTGHRPILTSNIQEEWGFGQLLSLFLLIVVGLSIMEAWPTNLSRAERLRNRGVMPDSLMYSYGRVAQREYSEIPLQNRGPWRGQKDYPEIPGHAAWHN